MKYQFLMLIITIIVLNISGCIGATSSNYSYVIESDLRTNPYLDKNYLTKPNRAADKVSADGLESYIVSSELKWCGFTIYALLLPIPLMLPVCHSNHEVSYKDGKPVRQKFEYGKTYGAVCGPFTPTVFVVGSAKKGFCE